MNKRNYNKKEINNNNKIMNMTNKLNKLFIQVEIIMN